MMLEAVITNYFLWNENKLTERWI